VNINTPTHTVAWITEELHGDDVRFPTVRIADDIIWEAHHSCSERTTWLDGHLVTPFHDTVLDIVPINGADEAFEYDDFDLPDLRARAREAWDRGEVIFIEEGALIVPFADLTEGNVIGEALRRFHP
jgi:hypothetical protein